MANAQDRILAAAAITGHSPERIGHLMEHLGTVVTEDVRDPRVATNGDATSIAVSIEIKLGDDLDRRMTNLAAAISPSQALLRTSRQSSDGLRVERGIGPQDRPARGLVGVFSSTLQYRTSSQPDDLALAEAAGLPATVTTTLVDRLHTLLIAPDRPSARRVRTTVFLGPSDNDTRFELAAPAPEPDDLLARLARLADPLSLTTDDLTFLRAVHPAIAAYAPASVAVSARKPGIEEGFALGYSDVALDDALAVVGKYGDLPRVQELVTAVGAGKLAFLELAFGARELGPLWLELALD